MWGNLYDSDVVKGNLKVFGWAFGIPFDMLQESSAMIKMVSPFFYFLAWKAASDTGQHERQNHSLHFPGCLGIASSSYSK